jgi:hypothetical protein
MAGAIKDKAKDIALQGMLWSFWQGFWSYKVASACKIFNNESKGKKGTA